MSILDTKSSFKGCRSEKISSTNQELKFFFFMIYYFFSFRYVDRSKFYSIREITVFDVEIQVIGLVKSMQILGVGKKTFSCQFY